MAIYSGFTMIYPLKVVIFHSYVSFPEATCCEKQKFYMVKICFKPLDVCPLRPLVFSSPATASYSSMENQNMNKTANIHPCFDYDDISG
jgi:hypothetical protein